MSMMPALWAAMTAVQRAAWRTFAADPAQELENSLGVAYYASGYNWFCKCNVRLLRVGRATIVPVPTQARPAAPVIDDFRVTVGGSESDLCTCGVATASTETGARPASKAFDNNLTTAEAWITAIGNPTGWLQYVLCVPAVVQRYRLYMDGQPAGRFPKDWEFQVWFGGGWVPLHAVTNAVMPQTTWTDYHFPNTLLSDTYRINITANQGDANYVTINEMEYYLGVVENSVVCFPEDEFDDAPDYDLVLHISQGLSPALLNQYPGFYEIIASQSAGRWFHLFQTELEEVFGVIQMERSWFCDLYRQTQEGIRSAGQADSTVTIGG